MVSCSVQDDDPLSSGADASLEDLAAWGAGAAVTILLVPAIGPGAGVAGAVVSATVKGLSSASRVAAGAAQRRAQLFDENLRRALALGSTIGFEDAFRDERTADAILHGYRAAMDALDPAVLPALARLVSWYRGAPLDAFFRGASRVLQDLSARELQSWRLMVLLADDAPPDAWAVRISHMQWGGETLATVWATTHQSHTPKQVSETSVPQTTSDDWNRLFDLCERNHLAARDDRAMTVLGVGQVQRRGGDAGLHFRSDTIQRLANLLRPPDRAGP